ncbi:hypothetical protein ES703_21263 [subsurface metagenome]
MNEEIFFILVVSTVIIVIPLGVKRNKFSLSLTRPFTLFSIRPSVLLSVTKLLSSGVKITSPFELPIAILLSTDVISVT